MVAFLLLDLFTKGYKKLCYILFCLLWHLNFEFWLFSKMLVILMEYLICVLIELSCFVFVDFDSLD